MSFGHLVGFGGILVIFRFRGYFGNFLVLGYILVILFLVSGVFPSFFRFRGYLCHFLVLGGI